MAARTSTVKGLEIDRAQDDAAAGESAPVRSGTLWVANESGSSVVGGTDTLDTVLATAIQNELRNGRTVTARSFCLKRGALTATTANPPVYARVWGTTSGTTTCSINPVLSSDFATNATIGATDVFEEPYGIYVTWTEA